MNKAYGYIDSQREITFTCYEMKVKGIGFHYIELTTEFAKWKIKLKR